MTLRMRPTIGCVHERPQIRGLGLRPLRGQQDMPTNHQACLAHVLHDVQYTIACGDAVFAPAPTKPLASPIAVG